MWNDHLGKPLSVTNLIDNNCHLEKKNIGLDSQISIHFLNSKIFLKSELETLELEECFTFDKQDVTLMAQQ